MVVDQFIYPAVFWPEWSVAAAGFLVMTIILPLTSVFPQSFAAPRRQSLATLLLPNVPKKKRAN